MGAALGPARPQALAVLSPVLCQPGAPPDSLCRVLCGHLGGVLAQLPGLSPPLPLGTSGQLVTSRTWRFTLKQEKSTYFTGVLQARHVWVLLMKSLTTRRPRRPAVPSGDFGMPAFVCRSGSTCTLSWLHGVTFPTPRPSPPAPCAGNVFPLRRAAGHLWQSAAEDVCLLSPFLGSLGCSAGLHARPPAPAALSCLRWPHRSCRGPATVTGG